MSIMTLYIVVESFISPETGHRVIGGTETWTAALIDLSAKMDWDVVVLQKSQYPQITADGNYRLITWQKESDLHDTLRTLRKSAPGIVLLYGETFHPHASELPTVLIHHGIGGDGTFDKTGTPLPLLKIKDIRRRWMWFRASINDLNFYRSLSRVIAVDTNVINQFRYAWPMIDVGNFLTYVPNWGDVLEEETALQKWGAFKQQPVVLFLRRFRFLRGALLWAECLKQLAPQFPGVEFHCVGHGEYQEPFGLLAKHFKNVKTYLQPHDKVKELYERSHLSVVPSLYSEGTSLSAIEAMCGGCAVIASNVGGLGNLIIPDANGYLIEPTVDNFTRVVTHCLKSPEETQAQGMRAREIAKHGLSLECWEKRITAILLETMEQRNSWLERRFLPHFHM